MSFGKYWTLEVDDTDDEDASAPTYKNIIHEEEFEDDDDPEGFVATEPGSTLDPQTDGRSSVKGWDPSEIYFVFL
jgi:hypothetical protein